MEKIIELPCIVCPMGCKLKVTMKDNEIISVTGNKCKRGVKYANNEVKNPVRTITTTVTVINGIHNVCPVRTDGEVNKDLIFKCMGEINKIVVTAPIKKGQIIIKNILDSGVNVISTRNLTKI